MTSRARVLVLTLALVSMDSPTAQSQGEAAREEPASIAEPAVEDEAAETAALLADAGPERPPDAGVPIPLDPDKRREWLVGRATSILGGRSPLLGAARVGIAILDATTGKPLVRHDPEGRYNLASVTKVITSSAALAFLGPAFRWRTAVYADRFDPRTGEVAGDLYMRGRGDPTLTSAHLQALAAELRRAGVRTVRGGIAFDGTYFDTITEPPHFAEQPLERAGFRAPIGAFAIDGNTIEIEIVPDPTGAGPATVALSPPPSEYVELALAQVGTIARGRTKIRVDVRQAEDRIRVAVSGQLRFDEGMWSTRRRIDDPVRFASEALRGVLAGQGIRVTQKKARLAEVPRTARILAVHESAPLADIVREMNKQSNNFYAETLLKTLGAETRAVPGPATWHDGLAAVRRWLIEEVGLADGSFRIGNGSGLFGASDFTPLQVATVMSAVHRDFRVGSELMSTLSVAGVDGTLRRRFAESAGRGRIRAKTGTLETTSTLAGYVAIDGRRPLAFAILVNDIPVGQRGHARLLQDALLEACIAYLDTP